MLPSGDRPTIASGEETDAASEVPTSGRSKPPRKPLTQYESALLETKAAANAVASTGAYNHKSKSMSSETQTVRQNDNLERMINSLDPKGGSSSGGSVMSDISSYDVDANDIFSRSPGQAPSGDFVQYSENAPSPRKRRARRSKEAQEEPQTGDADSLPPWAHGAPSNEAASQQLAAAQPRRNPRRLKKTHRGHRFKNSYPGILPRRRSLRLRLRRPRRARVPSLNHRDFLSRHYFHPPLRNPARIQSRNPRVQPIQLASRIFSVSTTTRRKWTKLRRRRRPSPIRARHDAALKVCLKMVLGTKKNQVRVNWERMTT